jgi:hypothetical protein
MLYLELLGVPTQSELDGVLITTSAPPSLAVAQLSLVKAAIGCHFNNYGEGD